MPEKHIIYRSEHERIMDEFWIDFFSNPSVYDTFSLLFKGYGIVAVITFIAMLIFQIKWGHARTLGEAFQLAFITGLGWIFFFPMTIWEWAKNFKLRR